MTKTTVELTSSNGTAFCQILRCTIMLLSSGLNVVPRFASQESFPISHYNSITANFSFENSVAFKIF